MTSCTLYVDDSLQTRLRYGYSVRMLTVVTLNNTITMAENFKPIPPCTTCVSLLLAKRTHKLAKFSEIYKGKKADVTRSVNQYAISNDLFRYAHFFNDIFLTLIL